MLRSPPTLASLSFAFSGFDSSECPLRHRDSRMIEWPLIDGALPDVGGGDGAHYEPPLCFPLRLFLSQLWRSRIQPHRIIVIEQQPAVRTRKLYSFVCVHKTRIERDGVTEDVDPTLDVSWKRRMAVRH